MTSRSKDEETPPAAAATKRRHSCNTCSSAPSNERYATASQQQASPASSRPASRRNSSQLKTLTLTSTQQTTSDSNHSNTSNNRVDLGNNHASSSSSSASASALSTSPSPSPASSSFSFLPGSAGFKLNFNTGHSQPRIKCHIDHLHKDLELDVKLDCNGDTDNNVARRTHTCDASRFTIACFNPNDPDKNIKLRVELVKTSSKGFGLRITQQTPGPCGNKYPARSKGEKSKESHDSRCNSIRSESSRDAPKPTDICELDEVRMSCGKSSKEEDLVEDHCRCATACGVPGCRAREAPKDREVSQ